MANKEYEPMAGNHKQYIIFSVFQGHRLDWASHKVITDYLEFNSIPFKELDGCYNGVMEKSIIMPAKFYEFVADKLENDYFQESVLFLDSYKHGLYKASLLFLKSDEFKDIGYLRSAPENIAKLQSSWSFDPMQNKYFIVTESDTTKLNELDKIYAGMKG